MSFESFLTLTAKIAEFKYPYDDQAISLQKILENHMIPLHEIIIQ